MLDSNLDSSSSKDSSSVLDIDIDNSYSNDEYKWSKDYETNAYYYVLFIKGTFQ